VLNTDIEVALPVNYRIVIRESSTVNEESSTVNDDKKHLLGLYLYYFKLGSVHDFRGFITSAPIQILDTDLLRQRSQQTGPNQTDPFVWFGLDRVEAGLVWLG
jgi:hypothetical protein